MKNLLEILENLHPEVDYKLCNTLIDDNIFDSFDIVSLISEIDDVFDVTIEAHHITPENFNSAESIYNLIEELKEEKY